MHLHIHAIGADGRFAVVDIGCRQRQRTAAGDGAFAAIHTASDDVQALCAGVTERALLVDEMVCANLQRRTVAGDATTGVVQLPGDIETAVGSAGSAERTGAVGEGACLQRERAITGDGAAVVIQCTGQLQVQNVAAGGAQDAAGGTQTIRADVDTLRLRGAAEA